MTAFLERACPCCGANDAKPEMRSTPRGEDLDLAGLDAFWSGLDKQRVFFTYARCGGCGLLYCPRYFSNGQLAQLYANLAPNMDVVPSAAITATQLGYWRTVADAAGPGDYLEVGPDIGHIVAPARASGRFGHFWLYEPNLAVHGPLAAATGGAPATIRATLDDFSEIPAGSVSLAVMIHVLDHIVDPLGTLRQIRATLKPGGQLLIVTHNERSLLRTIMGRTFPPFCLQHPELYNPASITTLLERAGFAGVDVRRSVNHFPVRFLAQQAGQAAGLKLDRLPLPNLTLGLKLGNILTIARA